MKLNPSLLAFVSLSMLLLTTGCSERSTDQMKAPAYPPLKVQVETLTLSDVASQVEVAGTLQAVDQALISSRVSGQVAQILVHAGSKVKKDQLLVKISAAEINARVRQAETQLAQSRRNLERETRLQQLNASTREKVKTLSEELLISEAAYREASTMLGYTEIRAPFAGTITRKLAEVGDLASPGSPLLRLENAGALEVLVQIPEALVQGLRLKKTLLLTVPVVGLALEAQISEISPTADPVSRTTQLKLTLPENPSLRSGQFARVSLSGSGAQTLLVPKTALHQQGQLEQVFVVEQGAAQMRLVRSGARLAEQVEILSGLRAGEQVISAAEGDLHDGQPVIIDATGLKQ